MAWHPPAAGRFVPPLAFEAPTRGITEPLRSPALWVDLRYPDGSLRTMKGLAMAWTRTCVLAQWIEYSRAREAWVDATRCRRRELKQQSPTIARGAPRTGSEVAPS